MADKKKDLFIGGQLEETDIPIKTGRTPAYEWNKVLATIQKGKVREISIEAISKATLNTAVKAYNEANDTNLKVISRTLEDKSIRIFVKNTE